MPKRLKDLKVFRISLVYKPAVPKALYHIIKSLQEDNMEKLEALLKGLVEKVEEQGELLKAQQVQISEIQSVAKDEDNSADNEVLLNDVLEEFKDMSADMSEESLAVFTNTIDSLMEVSSDD